MWIDLINDYLEKFPKGTLPPGIENDLICAIHEAGHALVATHLGVPWEFVHIIPDDLRGGSFKRADVDICEDRTFVNWIKALLSGMCANACFISSLGSEKIEAGGAEDLCHIAAARDKWSPEEIKMLCDGLSWDRYLENLKAETCKLLRVPYIQETVFETAGELMAGKCLEYDDVKLIYDMAKASQ